MIYNFRNNAASFEVFAFQTGTYLFKALTSVLKFLQLGRNVRFGLYLSYLE
jgi:hypothetical protein